MEGLLRRMDRELAHYNLSITELTQVHGKEVSGWRDLHAATRMHTYSCMTVFPPPCRSITANSAWAAAPTRRATRRRAPPSRPPRRPSSASEAPTRELRCFTTREKFLTPTADPCTATACAQPLTPRPAGGRRPRSCAGDPFDLCHLSTPNEVREYRRYYYANAAEYFRLGGCQYTGVSAAYIWGTGSWDALAVYPGDYSVDGSFADAEVTAIIEAHNLYVQNTRQGALPAPTPESN